MILSAKKYLAIPVKFEHQRL